MEYCARLREDWYQTDVAVGNYVHIISNAKGPLYIIDNREGMIVVNPDTLVSATHVADSFQCARRSVFQDLCRVTNENSPALVYGKILHEVFQACVLRGNFGTGVIEEAVNQQISRSLEDLWSIGETEASAATHLMDMVPNLQDWERRYNGKYPAGAINVFHSNQRDKTLACVSKVLDIEEHIWSPTWGIKGNIDASLEVKTQTNRGRISTHIMPFELKTGKSTTAVSHRAQASLYTLMMQDRYDVDVTGSLLYYMKTGEMIKIPHRRDDIRGLLISRNKLASAITSRQLPEMLQNSHACTKCYSLNTCLVYHKAVEGGDAETSKLGSLFDANTGHLNAGHLAFFKKWERLLTKEEGDIQTLRKEVWTMTSNEREKNGSCLSEMKVVTDEGYSQDVSKVTRFAYTMKKAFCPPTLPAGKQAGTSTSLVDSNKSFLSLQLSVGDPIVISSEQGHYALAIGFLTHMEPDSITVSVDRRLKGIPKRLPSFEATDNQVYNGIRMDADGIVSVQDVSQLDLTQALYRVDKDEFSAGMSLVRGNLINLFVPDGDEKRRRLIVDLHAPQFRTLSKEDGLNLASDMNLNVDQHRAVQKVLTAQDYALILGMPGTGKTTTISQIIKSLVQHGKSVLLSAYTHSALDNVLLKLKSEGVDFVRLGGAQRVHPEIRDCTPQKFTSVNGVKEYYDRKHVVATTCLGIKQYVTLI
ncbi:DNA replication factor Dna2-domain-containing protein [Chytriomyces sp. MP71]|nr:DNA replication factor Dna2-domain-containing protein [Chytriomyces sp. MP71]